MDFLASFNFGGEDPAAPESSACASLQDLQLRLREALADKATPMRAEHVAAARFTLSLSAAEYCVLEGLSNLDPSLGGLHSESVTTDGPGEQLTRQVSAADSLTDQPQDDPVLQRAIARHVISAVSATDGSVWVMREMARGLQGWNFTYLCKDSLQHWQRQNKAKPKLIIAEYTQKDMDPALAGRPAFDCRGTIRISFARGGRSISIKYDHTPLHQTVAQVADYFKPPPRPAVPQKADQPNKQKTPKKAASARKKRDSTKAQDDNGNPRKRRKKSQTEAQLQVAPAHEQQTIDGDNLQHDKGSLQVTDDGAVVGSAQAGQVAPPPSAAASFPLNLSPEEAARRRDAATKLLTEAGVEPGSLSTEQFNIFANQSPDLQKESLNMLVKYGAERLRIVHPSNRDSSASVPPSSTTSPAQTTQAAAAEPTTTTALAPQGSGAADGAEGAVMGTKPKRRKMGKSRNACFQCKGRKVPCPRERPTCAECQSAGMACEYAPPKPRKKRSKSDAIVPTEYDAEEDSRLDAIPPPREPPGEVHGHAQMAGQPVEVEAQGDESIGEEPQAGFSLEQEPNNEPSDESAVDRGDDADYSSYPQVPVSDMLTTNVDMRNHAAEPMHQLPLPYFGSASGLALPQPEEPSASQHAQTSGSGLALPPGVVHYPSQMASAPADSPPRTNESLHLLVSPEQAQKAARGSRRSLPAGAPSRQSRDDAPASSTAASGWPGGVNPASHHSEAAMGSPQTHASQPHSGAPGDAGSRGPERRPAAAMSPRMQDAMALSQAALEQQRRSAQSLPVTMQPSVQANAFPSADDVRTKALQASRAGAGTARGTPPAEPAMGNASGAGAGGYRPAPGSMKKASSFDSYGRYAEALPNASTAPERIAYEPYTYQRSGQGAATEPAYDYGRGTASTLSTEDSPMASMASGVPPGSLSLADSPSGPRDHHAPSRNGSPYDNHNALAGAGRGPGRMSTSSPEFNLRTAPQPAAPGHGHGHGTVDHRHVHQQQQHQQRQRQQHRQQHQHQRQRQQRHQQPPARGQNPSAQSHAGQGQHGQGWYGFHDGGNASSYPFGLQRPGYGWKMSDEPWGGVP